MTTSRESVMRTCNAASQPANPFAATASASAIVGNDIGKVNDKVEVCREEEGGGCKEKVDIDEEQEAGGSSTSYDSLDESTIFSDEDYDFDDEALRSSSRSTVKLMKMKENETAVADSSSSGWSASWTNISAGAAAFSSSAAPKRQRRTTMETMEASYAATAAASTHPKSRTRCIVDLRNGDDVRRAESLNALVDRDVPTAAHAPIPNRNRRDRREEASPSPSSSCRVRSVAGPIADLNNLAAELHRAGKYAAALDALRDAEERRKAHISKEAAHKVEEETSTDADEETGCSERSTSMAAEAAEVEDGTVKLGGGVGTCLFPPRTSYIYQRMDFDEGMHSFGGAERMDPPRMMTMTTGERGMAMILSPAVEATLTFNAGQVHRCRGEFDAAAERYENALLVLRIEGSEGMSMAEKTTGHHLHPIVIPILHNIGQLQYRRGDLYLAMETYWSALQYTRAIYGPRHIHAASALNALGVLYYHANSSEDDVNDPADKRDSDYSQSSIQRAMELFLKSLSIRKERLGPENVDVATTLNNIGRIHVQRDEFDEALRHYEGALRIRRVKLGTDSLDYAATAFNAGQSLHQRGDLDRAAELYRDFLRVALIKFGRNHRDVAVVLSGIAQIHQEKCQHGAAIELYEESLRAGRAALGENHAEIAMLLNRMGNFHFELELLDDALRCYRRGLRIERRVLPPDHPNIVVTLCNMGEIHRQRSEWDDAAKMYCEALEILRKKHGEEGDSPDIASTLNTIGLIHDHRGDTCLSLRYLQDALVMRRRVLGDDHLDVSATLVYVGTVFYRKSFFSVAMELFTESLRIRHTALGKDHRDVAFVMYNVAMVHQQRGSYQEAIECYAETLRVEKLVLGERHRDVSMTLFKLGEAHKSAGELNNALECFQRSLSIERGFVEDAPAPPSSDAPATGAGGTPDPAAMARTLNEIGNILLARGDVVPMMAAFNEASRLYRLGGLNPNNVVVSGHLYALECSCPEAAPAA